MKKTAIIWFRNDLRLFDNEPLRSAVDWADEVICVFIWPERWMGKSSFGVEKMGAPRAKFMIESLRQLNDELKVRGNFLLFFRGNPAEQLKKMIDEIDGDVQVYASKEVTAEETAEEERLIKSLGREKVHLFWQATLVHPADLPFSVEQLPAVFTSFRKKVEKYSQIRRCFPEPEVIPKSDVFSESKIPDTEDLGYANFEPDKRAALSFKGGCSSARAHLVSYIWETRDLAHYKETRNGLIGAGYSSKFSPWLANGCLSPRQIYWEVKRFEQEDLKSSSTYWMFFELLWRDYFRFVASRFGNRIFQPEGIRGEEALQTHDSQKWERWINGTTGVPFVDANMRELALTGFMSNRGRQNVASYWVKDLQQDWRLGAAWFENSLIDYDVTSNWGNWMYVAGVGNDPRENRYFNIISQAHRYDSNGEYVKLWCPELRNVSDEFVHQPWKMPEKERPANFVHPLYISPKW